MSPDTFLIRCGIYQNTNSGVVRELTVETNKLWFDAHADNHNCSSGSYHWSTAHRNWFVYVAKDMRVWAFDGDQFLILLEANGQRGGNVTLPNLKERPPDAVVKRLPRAIRKRLPPD